MHPIHRRYHAEDLVRLRRAGERRRQVASQRRGRIDPNPHQIDAVMFALRRIPEGGCILADEVGLGKTIEAGLVIAQLLAEGARRVLIVLPRPLVGQWQHELYTLFGIEALEASDTAVDVAGPGVFLAGREYAGGAAGFERLSNTPPFDLVLIDEAHEVFAGIYRRYDRLGVYDESSPHASTAARVRRIIGAAPVLLLTATPIQNSLNELWGLVQYIDRSGTLLGARPDFEQVFCTDGSRAVADGQAHELRRRLALVVQRTLRRQAQEFLDRPFVGRRAQLFEYNMSVEERALYNDVTDYLLQPGQYGFSGGARQLLLLGFHRRMASSIAALAQSLEKVAERLRVMTGNGEPADEAAAAFAEDLEETAEDVSAETPAPPDEVREAPRAVEMSALQAELARVEDFVARARALPVDSKAQALLKAVQMALDRTDSRDKVVIFTESLTTQDYLRDLLTERTALGPDDVTLFRGNNNSPRAMAALDRWRNEVEADMAAHLRPSPGVAVRLALVHEFRTRSKVFISSEAGAKGLNLQFCDTLVNYDLPWNPQRIEQRIGRCHRYGQLRDVTVINFLARDNEAQRLTFEILATKLDLFGKVLDASDVVLQTPRSDGSEVLTSALGGDFETELRRIWDRARSVGEVEDELRRLSDAMEARRQQLEDVRARTVGLIENALDESVRGVFRRIREELPATLAELDDELERTVTAWLEARNLPFGAGERDGRRVLHLGASPRLPEALADGVTVALGASTDMADIDSLHAAHPLVEAAVADARTAGGGTFRVAFTLTGSAPPALLERRGARGRLALTRIRHRGFEHEDHLQVTAVFDDAEVLRPAAAARELLLMPCEDVAAFDAPVTITAEHLDEVISEELFMDASGLADTDQANFERAMDQLDQYVGDRLLVLRRARDARAKALTAAEQRRDAASGAEARGKADTRVRTLETGIEQLDLDIDRLVSRDDETYERWRADAHQRRYQPPESERLLEAEFVIR